MLLKTCILLVVLVNFCSCQEDQFNTTQNGAQLQNETNEFNLNQTIQIDLTNLTNLNQSNVTITQNTLPENTHLETALSPSGGCFLLNNQSSFPCEKFNNIPLENTFLKINGTNLLLNCQTPNSTNRTLVYKWYVPYMDQQIVNLDVSKKHVFEIKSIDYAHQGFYVCQIFESEELVDQYRWQLTVRDEKVALWPFIGVFIQVVVCCILIMLYEKRASSSKNYKNSCGDATICRSAKA